MNILLTPTLKSADYSIFCRKALMQFKNIPIEAYVSPGSIRLQSPKDIQMNGLRRKERCNEKIGWYNDFISIRKEFH